MTSHDKRERLHPHAQAPHVPRIQLTVTPETDDVTSEDFHRCETPHHHQLDHDRQLNRKVAPEEIKDPDLVSECLHIHLHSDSQQPQFVMPPSEVQQTQTLATQGSDEDSATADPQNRVSDRSRSSQEQEGSRRQGPQIQKGTKTTAEKAIE